MELKTFTETVSKIRAQILRTALCHLSSPDDAEDAVQETMAILWVRRNSIPHPDKMLHFATVVVRSVSIDMLRKRKRTFSLDEVTSEPLNSVDAQRTMEEQEQQLLLKQAVSSLSNKQQAIVRMRNVENLSYAEIASILGTTESSVRGTLSRARATLINQLNKHYNE